MNIFRLFGDSMHVVSYLILFFKIFKTKSTKDISCKMYLLLVLVFMTRYFDLLKYFVSVYNTVMKIVFITMSCAMVFMIHVKFPRKVKDFDSFRIEFLIAPALILALLVNHYFSFMEVSWTFSIYLEAVAILPQLFLVWNSRDVHILTCAGVFALASYRGFYILNWIYRYIYESRYDNISVWAGVIQTVLYSFTAAVMISIHRTNVRKSKVALVDSMKEDLLSKDFEVRSVLQDQEVVTGVDVIASNGDVVNFPVPFCIETELLKLQNQVVKDEPLPQVFVQNKTREN